MYIKEDMSNTWRGNTVKNANSLRINSLRCDYSMYVLRRHVYKICCPRL